MRFFKGLSCVLGLAGLASAKTGWKLDKSCKTDDLGTTISEALLSAFNMAKDELDAINKVLNNEDLGDNGDNIRDVLKWMFMKDGEEPNQERLGLLQRNLGTLVAANEDVKDEEPDPQTIIVYCDFSRFESRSDNKWYDKDIGEVLEKGESFKSCESAGPTVAYTLVSGRTKPSQVQLCPWFIDWMRKDEIAGIRKLPKKSRVYDKLSTGLVKMDTLLSPIDVLSNLDKVILHELTHTRNGGESKDVDDSNLLTVRYAWKRCRKLAKEGPTQITRQAQNNADSIALAGSAIRFIKEGSKVTEDGKVLKRSET